ncbi:transposase [Cyanobium sp. ATX 6A2]|uniref:transposase n=1 Tax=Cyanobium sp. ATX 6A2 TaxID=2823700 RepID=UPI0037C14215|nr:transposase [Cyanobium sp. ATX 6A2]
MVRGKARADVEFGAKISVSVRNGFAFLHRISWDPYNEAEDLIPQAKKYKQEYGCYPERICADRIYINTRNRNFCTRNNIRLSGKRLGRPPKDPEINAAYSQQLSADQRKRNEVEGCFGSGKRKYALDLVMPRLHRGAENSISMAFVVMCAEKIRRLLRLFFVAIFPGYVPCNGQVASGWSAETLCSSEWLIHWSLYSRAHEPPTPCSLTEFGSILRFSFSGVPNQVRVLPKNKPWLAITRPLYAIRSDLQNLP